MKQEKKDWFTKIEWYAVRIVSRGVFLVFLYVTARYEIMRLLGK